MASSRGSVHSRGDQVSCDQFTMAMINRYLQTTGIEGAFKEQCHQLLKSPHLPYNPYPGLVRQLRAYAESFTYHSMDDDDIFQQLVYQVQNTTIPEIVQPITGESVYGTQNSIEMMKPSVVEQYRWLLKNVTPPVSRLHQVTGYVNQVVTALLGPATLHGTFYPHPASINFRVEFIIIGPDVNQAVAIFLESVTNDILHMESSGTHIFLGLTVPVNDPNEKDKWQQHIYPVEMLQNQKAESWEAIYDAMVKHQKISAECLFRLSEGGDIYRRGQKQYCLNFVEIDEKTGTEKGFQFFSDFPFATLYEGIFLQRSYAEAYVNMFLKRLNFFEDAGNFEENLSDAHHHAHNQGNSGASGSAGSRHQPQPSNTASQRPPTHLRPFLDNCQRMVASFHSPSQIFEIVPYALTLITADRESYPVSLTTDLYKMLRSTAAHLHHLMQQNRTIQEVIQHLLGTHSSTVVNKLFKQYRNSIVELFSRDEISDDVKSVGQVVMRGLTVITGGDTVHVPVNVDTLSELSYLNVYCRGLFYQLAEDVLRALPELSHFIEEMQEVFPDMVPFQATPIERTSDLHGMEDYDIWNHGNEVLNVQSCMRQVGGPRQIAQESVLLTYVVDTHLDDVWSGFLADLLTEGDSKLPKNPFPRLVSALRQATLSMELRAKTDDQLRQEILHGNVQVDDPTHYICTIPGHSVYGLSSALSALDVTTFEKLLAIAEMFLPNDTNRDVDVYKVAMSCAVSGHCTLYGVVDPYMRQIDLHEHCYITGPTGCAGDAFAVYAKLVYEELMTVSGSHDNVMLGVYMGREESLWNIASVKERRRGFVAELEHRFMAREPVYWKLFVWHEWRYIPVVKHLRLHYWNTELTEHQAYYPEDTADLYHYVFHSREEMLRHMKYRGVPPSADPYSERNLAQALEHVNQAATDAKKKFDWLNVHRWLLTGQLMQNDDSLVAEVWRSLHSPAAQLEYVIILGRSLSEIVHCGLELKEAIRKRNREISPLQREERIRDELSAQIQKLSRKVPSMLNGYWDKLLQVSSDSSSLAPECLAELLQQKLKSLVVADRDSNHSQLVMGEQTQLELNDIGIVLSYVQDAIAQDLHSQSPHAAHILEAIETELNSRPKSVTSVQLRNMNLQ